MAKQIPEENLKGIEEILKAHSNGVDLKFISEAMGDSVPQRTLRYRLRYLADQGRVVTEGQRRGMKYFPASAAAAGKAKEAEALSLSRAAQDIRKNVSRTLISRKLVGYNRDFLDSYRPNESAYLSEKERIQLRKIGAVQTGFQPAGTYARDILDRLLIDLSWNSSRLEGNTYSLLDTKRLIAFGKEAQGKNRVDAQMILNHKDAIVFLVDNADEIGFNRFTIRNLHGMLANNLLPDPQAAGRLRQIEVEIGQSAFKPLAVPQLIEECFDQILDTAKAISDPFEQSFFIMVHVPYLQPFEDVNKRVSRLAANIPLIKANLVPLTFADVPKDLYVQAMLGVYELNKVELLRDIYLWAYKRSAERYAAVRQSLGEPDPFRLKHRDALRYVVGTVVRDQFDRAAAFKYLETWTAEHLAQDERDEFLRVAEDEILALHEGNFARYQVRPSEFTEWRKIWDRK
jgi:fido (protein-threonine AMPylation protein)/DNA-binding transcriptional ArsR family regulator